MNMTKMLRMSASVIVAVTLGSLVSSCSKAPGAPTPTRAVSELAVAYRPVGATSVVTWECFTAGRAGIFSSGASPCAATGLLAVLAGPAAVSAPGTPSSLTSSVSGSTVLLTWLAAGTGDAATSYQVEAGSSPGGSNVANFDTGTTATSLTALGVPAATYYVRVRARNAAGTSAASNEVVVTVGSAPPCGTAPAAPSGLTGSVSGSAVTLTWNAPGGGCAPTNYILEAGSSSGAINLANFATGSTATSFATGGVGPGTYYVRVRSTNAAGVSGPSNEFVLVVGGSSISVTGRWLGLAPDGLLIADRTSCDAEQDIQLDLTQTGTTVGGTATSRTRKLWNPCGIIGIVATVPISGTAGVGTLTFTGPGERGRFITFSGTFTATRMTLTAGSDAVMTLNRQ